MENNKLIVAKNIIFCRKSANLTQAELAEKLNYSDKAVSKWERAEAIPDVFVLKQIADLFNVTVDYMITEHNNQDVVLPVKHVDLKKRRTMITMLSTSLVWFVATIIFVSFLLMPYTVDKPWIVFIWALPLTFIIHIVFSCIWGNRIRITISVSLFIWSCFIAICLSVPYYRIWVLLIIAIPMQLITILWFSYMHIRERAIKKEKENLINTDIK